MPVNHVRHALIVSLLAAAGLLHAAPGARPQISLNGSWSFRLDTAGVGEQRLWYRSERPFESRIDVPGNWQAEGQGDPTPFLRNDFEGSAWYDREVNAPAEWQGKKIDLVFEGSVIYTTAYVNGTKVGDMASMDTPFRFDITHALRPGQRNRITVRVANLNPDADRANADRWSEPRGCLHLLTRFGGILQPVYLEARDPVSVEGLIVSASFARSSVEVSFQVDHAATDRLDGVEATVEVMREGDSAVVANGSTRIETPDLPTAHAKVSLAVHGALPWSPETPNLYRARVTLQRSGQPLDLVEERFGFRDLEISGRKLFLNGAPLYIRGYGDDSIYPVAGTPPYDKAEWKRRFQLAKNYGFNAVRFHSMTPPRVGFEAADEVGMIIDAELPALSVAALPQHVDFLKKELVRTIEAYRNHPSWVLFAFGNEFNAEFLHNDSERQLLHDTVREFMALAKKTDANLWYLSNQGYMVEPTDIAALYQGVAPDRPTIKHEYGGYLASLPDISLIDKYSGVVRPGWLEKARDWITAHGDLEKYPQYLEHSWRVLQIAHKAYLEKIRMRPDIQGYFYWLISDVPESKGFGTSWEWGWFNDFWEPKGIQPEQGREVQAAIMPLISAGLGQRTFWAEDGASMDVFVSNYGARDLRDTSFEWELRSAQGPLQAGRVPFEEAKRSTVTRVGEIRWGRIAAERPEKLQLIVKIQSAEVESRNHWDFWCFPQKDLAAAKPSKPIVSLLPERDLERYFPYVKMAHEPPEPGSVLLAPDLSGPVIEFLEKGGRAVVLSNLKVFGEPHGYNAAAGIGSYLPGAFGNSLGMTVQNHPAMGRFPHDGFPDTQFYNLFEEGTYFVTPLPALPIIGGLLGRRVALQRGENLTHVAQLIEYRVGRGKLLLSTLNIRGRLDDAYPEAIYLLDQMLRYAASEDFAPAQRLSIEEAQNLSVPYTKMIH